MKYSFNPFINSTSQNESICSYVFVDTHRQFYFREILSSFHGQYSWSQNFEILAMKFWIRAWIQFQRWFKYQKCFEYLWFEIMLCLLSFCQRQIRFKPVQFQQVRHFFIENCESFYIKRPLIVLLKWLQSWIWFFDSIFTHHRMLSK